MRYYLNPEPDPQSDEKIATSITCIKQLRNEPNEAKPS